MGANVQVVWEKFCRYWDVEPRYVPVARGRFVTTPDAALPLVDEHTIGIVGILGTTYTGEFEPIKDLHRALVQQNRKTGWEVPIHVDAASGGFVAPFLHPELEWDFRLPLGEVDQRVAATSTGWSIPASGGWCGATRRSCPEDLIFHVNYLGGDMPTFTLNFSRPGNQVMGQYYNFLRLGRAGYTPHHGDRCAIRAMFLSSRDRGDAARSSCSATAAPCRCSRSG